MSQRTSRPRGPITVDFRVVAVDNQDNTQFALELQTALNSFVADGYSLAGQMVRGSGLILTGQRVQAPPGFIEQLGSQTPVGNQPVRKMAVRAPKAETSEGEVSEEVLYHYQLAGRVRDANFPSMPLALRYVQRDMENYAHDSTASMPISLTAVVTTRFEPKDFPDLLKLFDEELRENQEEVKG